MHLLGLSSRSESLVSSRHRIIPKDKGFSTSMCIDQGISTSLPISLCNNILFNSLHKNSHLVSPPYLGCLLNPWVSLSLQRWALVAGCGIAWSAAAWAPAATPPQLAPGRDCGRFQSRRGARKEPRAPSHQPPLTLQQGADRLLQPWSRASYPIPPAT